MAVTFSKLAVVGGLTVSGLQAQTTDLHIQLRGSGTFRRHVASFTCDGNGTKLGLPAGVFQVEYINGLGNSLAVLPIAGKSLIFANIPSASGARYGADVYTWSDGGSRGAFLASDSLAGKAQTLCQAAK